MSPRWTNDMDEVEKGFLNLHDAFLNATLMRNYMNDAPVEKDPVMFLFSDRGRFERLWVAFLAVLVEAWQAARMRQVTEWIRSVTDTTELVDLLREAARSGRLAKMVECRHYSFHRDKREYWDDGRVAPVAQLRFNERLHMAFSHVLLEAMRAVKQRNRDLKTRGETGAQC